MINGQKTSVLDYPAEEYVQVFIGINDKRQEMMRQFPELQYQAKSVKHVFFKSISHLRQGHEIRISNSGSKMAGLCLKLFTQTWP